MNFKKYFIPGVIGISLLGMLALLNHGVTAQSLPNDGLTFTKTQTKHWQYFVTQIANAANPGTSTASYNPAGDTDDEAGAINTTAYTQAISVEWNVGTLGSTGIDLTILGRFGGNPNWSLLHTESISAVTTDNTHGSITLEEEPEAVRVGRQATGTEGTDSIDIWVRGKGWSE